MNRSVLFLVTNGPRQYSLELCHPPRFTYISLEMNKALKIHYNFLCFHFQYCEQIFSNWLKTVITSIFSYNKKSNVGSMSGLADLTVQRSPGPMLFSSQWFAFHNMNFFLQQFSPVIGEWLPEVKRIHNSSFMSSREKQSSSPIMQ